MKRKEKEKMEYKLIAMDFDGTLLNDQKQVSIKTKETLMKYKEEGYIIVGVTARTYGSAIEVISKEMFNYFILNNGANIYDVKNDIREYIGFIPDDYASEITKAIESESEQIDYVSSTMYYTYLKKKNSNLSFLKDIDGIEEIHEKIARMNIFLKDTKKVEIYNQWINETYPNVNCFIMQDSKDDLKWLVINPKNLDKKATLKLLGERLGISLNEMIFFGDGLNDLVVMEAVGCGVAMGNALEEIKERANAVTTSNNEDGIAKFLEKKILI